MVTRHGDAVYSLDDVAVYMLSSETDFSGGWKKIWNDMNARWCQHMSTINYTSLRRWWKLIEDWKMRNDVKKDVKIWRYKDAQCQSINVKVKSSHVNQCQRWYHVPRLGCRRSHWEGSRNFINSHWPQMAVTKTCHEARGTWGHQ